MSGVLLPLQLTLMLTLAGASREELWVKARAPQGRVPMELLKYSSSQNIVHIILDSFQTDIFWELVAEEGLEDDLEGFVLFKENMGTAPSPHFRYRPSSRVGFMMECNPRQATTRTRFEAVFRVVCTMPVIP